MADGGTTDAKIFLTKANDVIVMIVQLLFVLLEGHLSLLEGDRLSTIWKIYFFNYISENLLGILFAHSSFPFNALSVFLSPPF